MKIFVYSYREFDEAEFFQKFSKEYGVELGICKDAPTLENAHLAEGYEYLSIITTKIDAQLVERFHELGVKMISTRTIGFDHIDLQAAKKFGMSVSNVSYSPECVADYTLMLMLMAIRKMGKRGLTGMEKMASIMQKLRDQPPVELAGHKVVKVTDYKKPEETGLPAANVLIYTLENGATVVVRPSGTEPKIKTYFTTLGKDLAEAQAQKDALAAAIEPILK